MAQILIEFLQKKNHSFVTLDFCMNNLVCNDTFDQDVRFLIRIYIFVNSTNLEVFLRWCAYIRTFTISHEKLKKCALEKKTLYLMSWRLLSTISKSHKSVAR